MIITCPNCATHYDIKPEAIKPTGSMMRCARCGYSWQQSVIHSVEVREQQITMPPAVAMAAPVAAPAQPAVVAEVPAPPPPMPEPEPEPLPEPEPEPLPEPEAEPEPEPEAEEQEEPLSQDELDNLFGEDEAPPVIESMIDTNIDDDEAETIEVDGDEEQDPIPEGLTSPMMDDDEIPVGRPQFKKPVPEKKKSIGMIFAIIFAVLFIGVAGGGVAFKDMVIKAVPETQEYYEAAGLYHVEPGEGLSHEDVKPRRDVRNGIDYLIIEGNVVNITEGPLAVPMLKVELTNTEGKAIRTSITELPKTQLEPGDKIPFMVEFENPPGTARSMRLGFATAEGAADGEPSGDGH